MRFVIVGLALLSASLLFGIILFLPAWSVADIKEQTVEKRIEILRNTVSEKQDGALSALLDNTRNEIQLLRTGEDFLPFRTVLETLLGNRTSGVSLQSFSFSRISAEGDVGITVRGIYRDRDALVNFRKNLEREKMFTRVDLPIANLAKGKNADFTIELTAVIPKP